MKRWLLPLLLVLVACAKREAAPLPGDSVSADGAVTLTPARVPVVPASDTRAPVSAIESKLFPPELVMEHGAEIALTAAQREAITKETDHAHSELLKLQWELDAEKEKLIGILDVDKVDEAKSKAAASEVMKRENAIKASHLTMLVRIRNVLTATQRTQLVQIRDADRCKR
jgi:Spy/CpxP family protein refolding chaperone